MLPSLPRLLSPVGLCLGLLVSAARPMPLPAQEAATRPMTFLDMQLQQSAGSPTLSPDGRHVLYTLRVPSWREARSSTDIYLVSVAEGIESTRQLTFTTDKNENSPTWNPDGSFFVFSSNREGTGPNPPNQLFLMRTNGGEAKRITDAKDGVANFEFTRDGRWLVYTAGKDEDRQLWALPMEGIEAATPVRLTKHQTPVGWWRTAPDSRAVYFIAPDTVETDNRLRKEKKFTVQVRNEPEPVEHLWVVDIASKAERRLTSDATYSVRGVTVSLDGRWIGYRATPNDRYKRNITESGLHDDVHLLETATGRIERLTDNVEVGESSVSFSPDGSMMAISAPNDWTYFRDDKIWVRPTADRGAAWRKLAAGYDGSFDVAFWSDDGRTIYANVGVKVTQQVMAIDVKDGSVRPITQVRGMVSANREEETGAVFLSYTTPTTPRDLYLVSRIEDLARPDAWHKLTEANPEVARFALGSTEEIEWRSTDGKIVGGLLVKPVGYAPGRRYPLIVQIHGGPAGVYVMSFNTGSGSQVYAGGGYAVFLPNYRGSVNYGEQHRLDIVGVGNYFTKGYEDIMTGVDYLVAQGIAAPDSLGAMGWSAGGHWSNWILTHTNRFKAISSGAGAMNWISMYAQSDVQRGRAEYFANGKLPYDDFEAYWDVSPLKFIKNARTPTMIHVVAGDPRVPRPQSEELHMALRQLGVPTEFYVYPGSSHGIPDPRNRYAKAVAEYAWFEHWIRGRPLFRWKDVLESLTEEDHPSPAKSGR